MGWNAVINGYAYVKGNANVNRCLYVQQPNHDITATNTHVFIRLEGHTWEYWEEHIAKIGKSYGYSKEEIRDTVQLLMLLKRQLERMGE